ncbi:MAG: FRG domain-containing protein [bacterium]
MFFEEKKINSWDEAKDYCNELMKENNFWIFRGHYKSEWLLQPSLERILSKEPIDLAIESKIITEFRRRAHQYLPSNLLPGNLLEWIALMQHYGAPTRLLDWTRSPYIAAFIAFENTYKESGDVAIWGINSKWLNEASKTILKRNKAQQFIHPKEISDEKLVNFINADLKVIVPIEPMTMNERLTIQQGLFLLPSGKQISFEESLSEYEPFDSKKFIKKIIIPKSEGLTCLVDLNRMNINAASLFPGLDGFARSLKNIPDIMYANLFKETGTIFGNNWNITP